MKAAIVRCSAYKANWYTTSQQICFQFSTKILLYNAQIQRLTTSTVWLLITGLLIQPVHLRYHQNHAHHCLPVTVRGASTFLSLYFWLTAALDPLTEHFLFRFLIIFVRCSRSVFFQCMAAPKSYSCLHYITLPDHQVYYFQSLV